ncbi:MAG: PIN domain-containing protein [Pirellulales bacterium]
MATTHDMKRSLLDTDIFSEVLKSRNSQVVGKAKSYRADFGCLTITTITVMEIVKGFQKSGQYARRDLFLRSLPLEEVLAFDTAAAEIAGRMYADLERNGQTIGRADPMIAAVAVQHGLTLVTANTAHFERIQQAGYPLDLDNWR